MTRTPIEMMVDRACGLDDAKAYVKSLPKLRCPVCQRTRIVRRDKSDPPGAAVVEYPCANCNDGNFGSPLYFDADGKQVYPE